jgi:plastocyanin
MEIKYMDVSKHYIFKKINIFIFFGIMSFLNGCAGTSYIKTSPLSKVQIVEMFDDKFVPSSLTVDLGQKVIWINKGHKPHNVTSDDGYFNSSKILPGKNISYVFNKPGIYNYSCTYHSFMIFGMKGTVIVNR